jgi:hypothetical protein
MTEPPNHSARNWTIGGVAGLAAILALVFGVPGNLLNSLQLIDRLTGRDTPSTSTSTPALPPGTTSSDHSSSTPWSPPDVPDPSTGRPPAEDPPSITQAPPSTTSEAPLPIPVVDRIQIETWAYDKAGLNTYRAANDGSKSIRVSWTASANGYEVNGACASSVRIQGLNTDQAKNSSNCSDSMGTYLDVRQPGNYKVTVTTHQDSGAEYSESIDVTVLPG